MNMSALINYQMLSSCNYTGVLLWTVECDSVFLALCARLCVQVEPFLPYEYTCEGMLERVHAYVQNQVGHKVVVKAFRFEYTVIVE